MAGQKGEDRINLENRFVKLYTEWRVSVSRYLGRIGVSPEEADDIVQEVFLRLFKHLLEQKGEENLRGWVFRVAHNLALAQYNDRSRLTLKNPEDWEGLCDLLRDRSPNPEELLIAKEKTAKIDQAICSLSDLQLQCTILRLEGFRHREIGEILGVSMATVAESLRRVINKTRESL
ncbi:MAG: RNA polymerase sigma factor [Blastocatellia bacterium]